MDTPIFELLPQPGQEHLELGRLPAQHTREQADADTLVAFGIVDELILADLFELLVLGPGVHGDLEEVLLDIHKACVFNPLLVLAVYGNWLAILLRRFDDLDGIKDVHVTFCHASVVGT